MIHRILIADDEPGVVAVLKDYFELHDYLVFTAGNGIETLTQISQKPDIILLDINMPKMDGLEVCKLIRQQVSCPILFLTARIDEADAIKGFQAGGDDYILKPFKIGELGARVEAHLRREKRDAEEMSVRFYGKLCINYQSRKIFYQEEQIAFAKKEFDIVELLSLNKNQIFDKERIYESIWGYDGEGDSSVVVEHIRRIRKKLETFEECDFIETIWGVGYRWKN